MFENLTGRLSSVISKLRGQARLTEEDISATLREVRMALLEADVAVPVVKDFIDHVRGRIDGQELNSSLTPGQYIIKIVHAELIALMGLGGELNLNVPAPAVILMAGLQGAGKTTTVAKLACWLRKRHGKKVMAVSCDVYRPAAIEQLAVLGRQHDFEIFPGDPAQAPLAIAEAAMQKARSRFMDVLLVDTAGRLHVDKEMMGEIVQIHAAIKPSDTLFIVDSMLGQDAVNSASAFNQALPLSGIILTKADGDARGGAALSVRHVTGKPILFMGTGEKIDELSVFHADRVASRILGMGDVLSLIEEVEQKTDRDKTEKLAKKLTKGGSFSLVDFREQLDQMRKMGGIASLMDKLPGLPKLPEGAMQQHNDRELIRLAAIIDSMTPGERRFPATINGSRKKRIANGSGMQIQDVNRLLKQFDQMQKMMKRLNKKGGMKNLMRGLSANLPRGFRR
ncbi:MAG: signal recognition particle protein [Gammaproteobacteria bacterium]|nr:MAG: signal recognition particle protein [Gammaproteobacteria bacterium]